MWNTANTFLKGSVYLAYCHILVHSKLKSRKKKKTEGRKKHKLINYKTFNREEYPKSSILITFLKFWQDWEKRIKYKLLTSEIKGWTLLGPIDIIKIKGGYSFLFFFFLANKFEKWKKVNKFLEKHNSVKWSKKKKKICIILYLLKKWNL